MNLLILHPDSQFILGDAIQRSKVLLKQLPVLENFQRQMGQSRIGDTLESLIIPLF
ncbi:hypothetical protein EVA_22445 [gut metagenome]|uniref:Uncharacterized protein n=1 Tax=gut metagenome TaxID=749906 RepID=J9F4L8_9ZZZZ